MIVNRRSLRLRHYDYSQDGSYFVTICCKNWASMFGGIAGGKMVLNRRGEIAWKCWLQIPYHFPNAILSEFVVMPNHIHGIVVLNNGNSVGAGAVTVGALHATPLQNTLHRMSSISPKPGTLSVIVRSYKSAVSKRIHEFI